MNSPMSARSLIGTTTRKNKNIYLSVGIDNLLFKIRSLHMDMSAVDTWSLELDILQVLVYIAERPKIK